MEKKIKTPIDYEAVKRAVSKLDLYKTKELLEFVKAEIKRKEKEEYNELINTI